MVAAYVKDAPQLPPTGSFPPLGRATPDVSALGEGYQVYGHGGYIAVGGTSASTPAFAALISLINEARLQVGGRSAVCEWRPIRFRSLLHTRVPRAHMGRTCTCGEAN